VKNEYCAKHRCVPVNQYQSLPSSKQISSATALRSCESSFDPYDLSSDGEKYLSSNNVAEMTPERSDRTMRILTAARLYLNSPCETPKNWEQINPTLNDYNSGPMEFSSTFWIPDITDWWCQQEEMHSKYTDLSNVARDIIFIVSHCVGVEASSSLGRDVISRRQSKTTDETLREKVFVRQLDRANNGVLAGTDPELDNANTESNSEKKKAAEELKLHRMAKVHHILEMWQGGQNLRATQKESRSQNNQMNVVGYISDTEEIVKASWSPFQHDAAAAFRSSKRSPSPPPLSAKDLPSGHIQILNVRRIRRIHCHAVESDEDSAHESISDTEDWLNWNGDSDNPNDSEDDCAGDVGSDMDQGNSIEDPELPEQRDVSTVPKVPGFSQPTRKSKRQAETVLVMVNAIRTRRNKGVKKK